MLDEHRLRRVLEVGRTVVSELDLETVLQRVLGEARELTGARYAALGILDEHRSELERFLTLGTDPKTPSSFLDVPIRVHGERYGNLYLTDKQDAGKFDEDDEETIALLAGWAGVAIANARDFHGEHGRRHDAEKAMRGLEAATEIARAVGGETDLKRILGLIVERARALIGAPGVLILLREGDELVVAAVAGQIEGELLRERVSVEGSVSGHVMQTQRSERLVQVRDQPRFAPSRQVEAQSGLFVPLIFRSRALGVLNVVDRDEGGAEFTAEDELLLEGFAASAATAVATAQTIASEGLQRSIDASERERQRWALELHDETLQELAAVKVVLSTARRSNDLEAVHRTLDVAIEQIDTEITGLRRLIADLRPAALDAFGAKVALEGLAARVTATSGLEIELSIDLAFESGRSPKRHSPAVESALYRLVQEALTNVVKHADASTVEISIAEDERQIEIAVVDDGAGFDPAAPNDGFGLLGMRERAQISGGSLRVESAPDAGTTIRVTLPIPADDEAVPRGATG